jgi:hypothetical protein
MEFHQCQVFDGQVANVIVSPEVFQIVLEHEEEERTEGAKDDEELDHEAGQAFETESDRGGYLHEGLLETQQPTELDGRGEHRQGDEIFVSVVEQGHVRQSNVLVSLGLGNLLRHLRRHNGLGDVQEQGEIREHNGDQVKGVVRVFEEGSTALLLEDRQHVDGVVENGEHEEDLGHSHDHSEKVQVGKEPKHLDGVVRSHSSGDELGRAGDDREQVHLCSSEGATAFMEKMLDLFATDLSIVDGEFHEQGPCSVVHPFFCLEQLNSALEVVDVALELENVSASAVAANERVGRIGF